MNLHSLSKFYKSNKGGIIGALVGVAISILILWIGWWKTFFIILLGVIGYYIGSSINQGRSIIREIIDRIIPPGTYR